MVGRKLQLRIIEINRNRNRLILSERQAVQEWRARRREELLNELQVGEVRQGVVSNLANFGAFVDLGGADGLVHISQLAWSRVNHPSEVLKVGQKVEVQVLSVDREKKKIALSIKRAEIDPWSQVEQRYQVGQLVTGTVTKIAPFGAFARIEDGVEGLVHLSEMPVGTQDPKQALHEGQEITVRILRIDPERRRLGLSLRAVDETGGSASAAPVAEPTAGESTAEVSAPATTTDEAGAIQAQPRPAQPRPAQPRPAPQRPEAPATAMAAAFAAAQANQERDQSESDAQPSAPTAPADMAPATQAPASASDSAATSATASATPVATEATTAPPAETPATDTASAATGATPDANETPTATDTTTGDTTGTPDADTSNMVATVANAAMSVVGSLAGAVVHAAKSVTGNATDTSEATETTGATETAETAETTEATPSAAATDTANTAE